MKPVWSVLNNLYCMWIIWSDHKHYFQQYYSCYIFIKKYVWFCFVSINSTAQNDSEAHKFYILVIWACLLSLNSTMSPSVTHFLETVQLKGKHDVDEEEHWTSSTSTVLLNTVPIRNHLLSALLFCVCEVLITLN